MMEVSAKTEEADRIPPWEMSVIRAQVRYFQLLAELRPLKSVEVGPGGRHVRLHGDQKPEMSDFCG